MKPILYLILLFPFTLSGQTGVDIKFIKKKNQKEVTIKTLFAVGLFLKSGEYESGTIYKKQDSLIYLRQHTPDSLKVNTIYANKSLKRKQRNALIDSIYKADTSTIVLTLNEIKSFSIPFKYVKGWKHKAVIWGNMALLIASSITFLAAIPVDEDEKMSSLGTASAIIYPISLVMSFTITSKRFDLSKWEMSN